MTIVIFGCGDVGRRIAQQLIEGSSAASDITAYTRSQSSADLALDLGLSSLKVDLDSALCEFVTCRGAGLYYTVAPQKHGEQDLRTRALLDQFARDETKPSKVVVISTTGVYGDYEGEWVTEESKTQPVTARGKRRLDSEQQWLAWGAKFLVPITILRVPGIYSYSRLPRERLLKRTPVVRSEECGFSNRIHADDLAAVCIAAMERGQAGQVYNATDGTPGKISEYLQLAAKALNLEPLPEITMQQAQTELSSGMLSYLSESRKISNQKMLNKLGVALRYPGVTEGIKH